MADETRDPKIWPLPKFRFSVTVNGETVLFQEVTGLDIDA